MGPPENLAASPVPPEAFNVARADIPHDEVELVEYDSKTLGIRRPLRALAALVDTLRLENRRQ
jgi:hypothetical protein